MSHIGEKVKQLRYLKKLTNSDFARILDMTENNLFSLYSREDTTTEIIKKIMAKMGVSSLYFFDDKAYIQINQHGSVNALGENSVNYSVAKRNRAKWLFCASNLKAHKRELIIESRLLKC